MGTAWVVSQAKLSKAITLLNPPSPPSQLSKTPPIFTRLRTHERIHPRTYLPTYLLRYLRQKLLPRRVSTYILGVLESVSEWWKKKGRHMWPRRPERNPRLTEISTENSCPEYHSDVERIMFSGRNYFFVVFVFCSRVFLHTRLEKRTFRYHLE